MNVTQALEVANSFFIPEFLFADGNAAIDAERAKNEEAIKTLVDAYFTEENPGFDFECVRLLADRNREFCDKLGASALRRISSPNIKRQLSDKDLIKAIAAMQRRRYETVEREITDDRQAFTRAYMKKPVRGTVVGIDIETTGIFPDRGYIINVGWEVFDLSHDPNPREAEKVFCGIPDMYAEIGVPLEEIHHINWDMIKDETPFRQNKELQKRIMDLLTRYPFMAHNAAFEDSWFLLNIDGYAEARKEGRIIIIDSRDICRKIDPEVARLPRESSPASLESWAKRRHTLGENEVETHQGLEDVDLMMRTVVAEFAERELL